MIISIVIDSHVICFQLIFLWETLNGVKSDSTIDSVKEMRPYCAFCDRLCLKVLQMKFRMNLLLNISVLSKLTHLHTAL